MNPEEEAIGTPAVVYPPAASVLYFDSFFPTLYEQYDLRFVYGASALASKTRRIEWTPIRRFSAILVWTEYR